MSGSYWFCGTADSGEACETRGHDTRGTSNYEGRQFNGLTNQVLSWPAPLAPQRSGEETTTEPKPRKHKLNILSQPEQDANILNKDNPPSPSMRRRTLEWPKAALSNRIMPSQVQQHQQQQQYSQHPHQQHQLPPTFETEVVGWTVDQTIPAPNETIVKYF